MKRTLQECLQRAFRYLFDFGARSVFCIILLPVLYLFSPFRLVRFVNVPEHRIGHFAQDLKALLYEIDSGKIPPNAFIVVFVWNPANRQLSAMWRQRFRIVEDRWLRRSLMSVAPLLCHTRFHQPLHDHIPLHEAFSIDVPSLKFTTEEVAYGYERLRLMGVEENDWFVCLHVREPAYLNSGSDLNRENPALLDDSLRTFRDSSIENYMEAAELITGLGGYVIRMGAIVERKLNTDNPRVIDYASEYRSDFMDIFLPAKCRFFLGGGSGMNQIALLFSRPVAMSNHTRYCEAGKGKNSIYIPKLIRSTESGDYISFQEAERLGFFSIPDNMTYGNLLLKYPVSYEENSPADIVDLSLDMLDRLNGISPSEEAQILQRHYQALFPSSSLNASPFAGKIGARFALKYRKLIEPAHDAG